MSELFLDPGQFFRGLYKEITLSVLNPQITQHLVLFLCLNPLGNKLIETSIFGIFLLSLSLDIFLYPERKLPEEGQQYFFNSI
jgi:hypothetical protein